MNGFAVSLSALRLRVDLPGRVYIKHPVTGAPLVTAKGDRAYVEVSSRDSAEWQRRERSLAETRSRAAADGVRYTAEEATADLIETLALMTRGWCLVDLYGGTIDLPFSIESARALYSDDGLIWLRDQVFAGTGDRSLFMPALSAA